MSQISFLALTQLTQYKTYVALNFKISSVSVFFKQKIVLFTKV